MAAETTGRVIGTPVERGSRVTEGSPLITLSQVEAQAAASDAEASVSQLEARLAIEPGEPFSIDMVPEVAAAKATRDLAEAEFDRIRSLLDQKVVSQAEFDQRRTQVEATSNQYRAARNAAQQQFRMLEGAKARLSLARKSLADTVVRAPFARPRDGAEGERRRLRHARHQGGDGGEDCAAPGRTHGARAVGRARSGRARRSASRSTRFPAATSRARSGSSRRRSAPTSARSRSRPSCRTPTTR